MLIASKNVSAMSSVGKSQFMRERNKAIETENATLPIPTTRVATFFTRNGCKLDIIQHLFPIQNTTWSVTQKN